VDCQTQSVTCHAVTTAFQMINSAGRNSAFKDLSTAGAGPYSAQTSF
jgi:hypothetical protein